MFLKSLSVSLPVRLSVNFQVRDPSPGESGTLKNNYKTHGAVDWTSASRLQTQTSKPQSLMRWCSEVGPLWGDWVQTRSRGWSPHGGISALLKRGRDPGSLRSRPEKRPREGVARRGPWPTPDRAGSLTSTQPLELREMNCLSRPVY